MGAAAAHRRPALFGPAAGEALVVTNHAPGTVTTHTVSGLSTADWITVFIVCTKTPSAEDLRMLLGIPEPGTSNFTDIAYCGATYNSGRYGAGVGLNTFGAGFVLSDNILLADGHRTLLTVSLRNNNVDGFSLRANGTAETTSIRYSTLEPRPFADTVHLGGLPGNAGLDWLGTIDHLRVYLSQLSVSARQQTEQYLMATYPVS